MTWPDPQIVSTVPAFKAELLERCNTWPDLDGVVCTWGTTTKQVGPRWLKLGRVTRTEKAAALGGQRRDETFDLTIHVQVKGNAVNGIEYLESEAYRIEGEVARILRAGPGDPTLGGRVISAEIVSDALEVDDTGDEWAARIACVIRVKNRI